MLQFCSNNTQWIGSILRNLQKHFKEKKLKMTHDITKESPPRKLFFQKYLNFSVLRDFENFNCIFFCYFQFFTKKYIFPGQTNFCFQIHIANTAKMLNSFRGRRRRKNRHYFPHRNEKSDFASIRVHKSPPWGGRYCPLAILRFFWGRFFFFNILPNKPITSYGKFVSVLLLTAFQANTCLFFYFFRIPFYTIVIPVNNSDIIPKKTFSLRGNC